MGTRRIAGCAFGAAMIVAMAGCTNRDQVVTRYGEGSGAVSHSAQESASPQPTRCSHDAAYLVRVAGASEVYAFRVDSLSWSPSTAQCVDSRSSLQERFQQADVCAQLAPAAANPGYDPTAKPAAPLNGVQSQYGTTC